MLRRHLATSLWLTVLFRAVPASGAVQIDSLQVPMDLALVLLGGQAGVTRIVVGAVPPELEESIPLGPMERVVGGLDRGSGGTVVVQVAGSAPQALATYVDHLRGQGWETPPTIPDQRGGFQPTIEVGQGMWCGEGYSIRVSSMSLDSKTYLRISYARREVGRNVCDPPDRRRLPRRDPFGGLAFPVLAPPPGAVVRPEGGGGSSNGITTEAAIESGLGLQLVVEHYAQQLAAAGWVLRGRAIGDGVSIGRWDVPDADGETVVGTMGVWSLGGGDSYRAWLRLDRPQR